ncbi:hypothetical protein IACHDJAJ_00147 [Aeromonas phage vB_AdhS_TS3]|nr:hypothetical protein IACHDJAJ_00147 [Aeromonas phage vB_AdhS_TS3]
MKVFCHRYKWGHDSRRRKLFSLLNSGSAKLLETNKDGWLFDIDSNIYGLNRKGQIYKRVKEN